MHYATKPPVGTPLNKAHRLNHGLMGYWPFWEGAGIGARDISGNNNHGTLTNFPINPWTGGKYGGALRFDAVDDYVDIPDSAALSPIDAMTVSHWFYDTTLTANQATISKWNHATDTSWTFVMNQDSAGQIKFFIATSKTSTGNFATLTATGMFSANQWTHVAAVYQGNQGGVDNTNNLKMYINGVFVTTTPNGSLPNSLTDTAASVRFGNIQNLGFPWNGLIDDVRIYNRALSAVEIQALAADPFCMYETESKFRWFVPGVATPAAGPPVGSLALLGVGR